MGDYANGRRGTLHVPGIGSIPISPTIFVSKFVCKTKRQFSTRSEALDEIRRLIEESFGGVVDLRPYKCKYCRFYHLTSFVK